MRPPATPTSSWLFPPSPRSRADSNFRTDRRASLHRSLGRALAVSTGLVLLLAVGCSQTSDLDPTGPVAGWPEYAGSKGGGHYSPLRQITKQNVDRLEIAWTYHTGDVATGPGAICWWSTVSGCPFLCA